MTSATRVSATGPRIPGLDRRHGNHMNQRILPLSVRTHATAARCARGLTRRMHQAWQERGDESGVDEAVTKMIWLSVGIGVALTATAFFLGVFETARSNVPDPIAP